MCSALARLAMDDQIATQIPQHNGVYLLGYLLQSTKISEKVHVRVFRALRFVYSVERNRKVRTAACAYMAC